MTLMTFDDLDEHIKQPSKAKQKAKNKSKIKAKKSPERFGEALHISGASSQPKVN
jgi:hypothetical protein